MNGLNFTLSVRVAAILTTLLFLLTGCVTDGGTTAGQYLDQKTPIFQQRTDIMIEAFEKGCLDRRIDEVIAAGQGLSWPNRKITLPVRPYSNTQAETTSLISAFSTNWSRNKIIPGQDEFLREVLKAQIADSPYVLRCLQVMKDVDYLRLIEAMKQTGYIGKVQNWRREKYGFFETQYYFTFPQDIPVLLSVITQSNTIKPYQQSCYQYSGCTGYGFNEARLELYIGLSTGQMPPVTIREFLNEMTLVASDAMRQQVDSMTRKIQAALTNYHREIVNRNNAEHAESQRRFDEAVARTKRNSMSDSQIFSSALQQSINSMQRQQKAFNDIDRKVGAGNQSQRRLDNAVKARQLYGDNTPSGSAGNSGTTGNSLSLTAGCPGTYVDPPAKYKGKWPQLRYGCDQHYKSEAEVQAVYAEWTSKREKWDAERAAMIKQREDAINRSRANAVKNKQKCKGCTTEK